MISRAAWMCSLVTLLAGVPCALVWAAHGSGVQPPAAATGAGAVVPKLDGRLSALVPAEPERYFELAEEAAAEQAVSPAARALARRLYVLAFATDAARPGPRAGELGPSCCLGLATLVSSETDRRWLRALAAQLAESRATAVPGAPRAVVRRAPEPPAGARLDLANALGLIRAGEGRAAAALLARPGVREAAGAYGGALSGGQGVVDAAATLAELATQAVPCRECRNRRFVLRSEPSGGGAAKVSRARLCPACAGVPGPRLTDAEVLAQLRVESAALRGVQQSWSAQVLADGGAPLRDPDPAEIPAAFQVDATKTVYRDGEWQKP